MGLFDLFRKKEHNTLQDTISNAILKSSDKKIYMADLYVYSEDGFIMLETVLVYEQNGQYIDLINDQIYISKVEYKNNLNVDGMVRVSQLGDKYIENFLLVPQRDLRDAVDYVINQNTIRRKGR